MIAERRREGVLAVRNEMSAAFTHKRGSGGVKKPSKGLSRAVWRHHFVCLAYYGQTKVPTAEYEKSELFEAGLGEKVKFSEIDVQCKWIQGMLYKVNFYTRLLRTGESLNTIRFSSI